MGLTIHYDLMTDLTKPTDVRQLVEAMRQFALDLPFQEVGELKEFKGQDTGWENKDDPDRWLKIQSSSHLVEGEKFVAVPAKHIIAFSTDPGEGCENANFGFCLYPAHVKQEKRRMATNMKGWRWHSFCKTQYASDPKCGGIENFLRCHLLIVKMLDFIKQTGLATVEVSDEGGYWEKRSVEALVKDIGEWNVLVAGAVSAFRSMVEGDGKFEAPITSFPNFEHLEAKGLDKIADLRRNLGLDGE